MLLVCSMSHSFVYAFFDTNKPLVLILLWPPGSGEGVLTVKVSKAFAIPHINTANLLRDASNEESELWEQARECLNTTGAIPDSLVMQLLYQRIKRPDCQNGFIMDGLPRTLDQTEEMFGALGPRFEILAVSIQIPDEVLLAKAEGRLICETCGRVYHKEQSPPEVPMTCDHCEDLLSQRKNDSLELVQKRLTEYRHSWEPIFRFYREKGLFVEVNGNCPMEQTFQEVKTIFNQE